MATPEFPLPPQQTMVLGIHQTDVIIQSAIEWGLADLRANPWLLNYVFASLPQDRVTARQYGQNTLEAAKAWFLKTNVTVQVGPILNEASFPVVEITLQSSNEVESEATVADTDAFPFEDNDTTWPLLAKLSVKGWNPVTGTLVVVDDLPDDVYMAAGMALVDNQGEVFQILETDGASEVKIAPNSNPDWKQCSLKSSRPSWVTSVESASFRETYRVGVHVSGEPSHLIWLHSCVVFALLRYKEALLEARGLERTTFGSTDLGPSPQFEQQPVFARYINVSGFVRQYWPKAVSRRIDTVVPYAIRVSGQGGAHVRVADADTDPDDVLWIGDLDSISGKKR